jgi:large subunit ribosomal protein L23
MAIFSKKENTDQAADQVTDQVVSDTPEAQAPAMIDVVNSELSNKGLIVPRISEKAGRMDALNKYMFTVYGKLNKIEVRKAVEKMYGVKIDTVNMVQVGSKERRFGRVMGKRSGFKKAIVTLKKDSKKINLVEPS